MSVTLEVTQIGDEVGLILPQEMLSRLRLGLEILLTHSKHALRLGRRDANVAGQIDAARNIMSKRRRVLRELAEGAHPVAGVDQ